MRLVFLNQFFSAHVHTKNFRNAYGSVCIQVVLQECDQHTRRSNYGVVQVCAAFLSVLAATRIFRRLAGRSPRLEQLPTSKYFFLTRRPCLNIDRFYFQSARSPNSTEYEPIHQEWNRSTVFFHSLSYHIMLSPSAGRQPSPVSRTDGYDKHHAPRCRVLFRLKHGE